VMETAVFTKFTQHVRLRDLLLSTGQRTLVEHTVKDSYWADGGDGSGRNQLGKTLMLIRDRIRSDLKVSAQATVSCSASTTPVVTSTSSIATKSASTGPSRVIFISASYLVKEYAKIPPAVMQDALFFFGSARSWVFPQTEAEKQESARQPTDYGNFPSAFKELIKDKDRAGLLYFLKPDCDYEKVSKWLTSVTDPVTGQKYSPLKLDDAWWQHSYKSVGTHGYHASGTRVVINYRAGEHDYSSVMTLLAQSNPSLTPCLQWHHLTHAELERTAARTAAVHVHLIHSYL